MKKLSLFIASVMIISATFFSFHGCGVEYGRTTTDMSYENLIAISLRGLQEKLLNNDPADIAKIKSFYGITRLYGFVWDQAEEDIILIGEAIEGRPNLHFDDFVVSLRNRYCFYCEEKNDTLFYSNPSCTIDPDPHVWEMLNELNNRYFGNDFDAQSKAWEEVCLQPQSVGVFGIPFNTHLASKMVNADYLLKDLTNGNITIQTDADFRSLHQLRREIVELAMKEGKEANLGSPDNRFEITSPEFFFKYDEYVYLLYSQPIVLVTEEEFLLKNTFSGTGKADPLSQQFANSFSSNYDIIAQHLPAFDSLWQSYRIFSIACAIKESDLIADTSYFSALFHHYPLDEVNVPSFVEGKSLVDQLSYSTDESIRTYYLSSCGGVNIGGKASSSAISSMKGKEIFKLVIESKTGTGIDSWEVKAIKNKDWILYINIPPILMTTKTWLRLN
jgi:hypothetical protein